jgi:hypothetical protein
MDLKEIWCEGMDWGSGWDPMMGSCKCGNNTLDSIKGRRKFLD